MKKIALKKIHRGVAYSVIVLAMVVPSVLFGKLFFHYTNEAEAFLPQIAVKIQTITVCTLSDVTARCNNCPFCGDTPACAGVTEAIVQPLNRGAGMAQLAKGQALCLRQGYAADKTYIKQGSVLPGHKCAGKIQNLGVTHQLSNFGCTSAPAR